MQRQNIFQRFVYSIQGRIVINFLIVGILSAVAALIILGQRDDLDQRYYYLTNVLQPSKAAIYALSNAVNRSNILLQKYIAASDNAENYEKQIDDLWEGDIKKYMHQLSEQQKALLDMEIKVKLATMQSTLLKLKKLQQEAEEHISREASISVIYNEVQGIDEKITAEQFFNSKVYPAIVEFGKEIEALAEMQDAYTNNYTKEIQITKSYYQYTWMFIAGFLFLVVVIITYYLSLSILGNIHRVRQYAQQFAKGNLPEEMPPQKDETQYIIQEYEKLKANLLQLKQFASEVGNGKFEIEVSIFDKESEIGSALENMRLGLIQVAVEDKRRNWLNEGLALFNNILRENSQNSQQLYESIIANLVQYTHSNQGGLFILNDDSPNEIFMELKAVYAYERKRFMQKKVYLGQGLIGQSWIEKDTIYLQNINTDFIQVSSGLGTAKPNNLLIVPMVTNEGKVLGIFEIASFHKFEEFEINFIKAVGNIVVSAIASTKNNEKNQRLLLEAQEFAQKMKAQEEMYKIIQIEFENLKVNHINTENLVKAYKQATDTMLAILEMDIEGKILDANATFLEITGYQIESLRGKNHTFLLKEEEANSTHYRRLWNELKEGISSTIDMYFLTKEGREVIFQTNFIPFQDHTGFYSKVLQSSYDMTKERRIKAELQAQTDAISKYMPIIEFDLKGNIIYANNLFLELMQYQLGEIKGKHHSIFVTNIERESAQYQELWARLAKGENVVGKFKRITKSGTDVWIKASYYPIADINGKPFKIVKYIQDITDLQKLEIKVRESNEIIKIQNEKIKAMEEQLRQILLNFATQQSI
ncbi:MAG: PAS domain S-box protein [Microscillaceae bacterium]|nr:PAS domain S-box protein [Microscillaceae bacterium]MDW8459966.1 PAS domain S-box protein [Cytophagales bacterium]